MTKEKSHLINVTYYKDLAVELKAKFGGYKKWDGNHSIYQYACVMACDGLTRKEAVELLIELGKQIHPDFPIERIQKVVQGNIYGMERPFPVGEGFVFNN